jgi:DNA-binding IclR family transcriptional regulator
MGSATAASAAGAATGGAAGAGTGAPKGGGAGAGPGAATRAGAGPATRAGTAAGAGAPAQVPDGGSAGAPAGGVAALDRALALLDAAADGPATLAELARRSGLHKSTILRLSGSLRRGGLIERLGDGRYRIGPGAFRLGVAYQRAAAPAEAVMPALVALAEASGGESAAFYAPTGGARTCLHRIESRHAIRYHVREGDVLPLDRGAGGRVIAAFSGWPGEPYATVRRARLFVSIGDRDPETAGVSAPVFGPGGALAGAITLAGPRSRIDAAFLAAMTGPLRAAAARATRALGGDPALVDPEPAPT